MSTTGTSCRRRGTSTILGTIIFVGIIFSAFIPMMLVMRQADTIYEIRKHELGILDQDRIDEEIYVYVFPVTGNPNALTLQVHNRGPLLVNVVQLWINDEHHILDDFLVQPMSWHPMVLDASTVGFTPIADTWYFIKIITDRGNIFSSDSDSLHYTSEGTWEGGMFAINFLISYPASGWYEVDIKYNDELGASLPDTPLYIHKSSSGPAFDFFKITNIGTYYVEITKNSEPIYEDDVTIGWPDGPPIVWVFV